MKAGGRILVTFALRQEGISFERKLTGRTVEGGLTLGYLGPNEIAISWLGIGLQDHAELERNLRELDPEIVINAGFAGGIRTLLEAGDFVLAENFSSSEISQRLGTNRLFEARGSFVQVNEIADPATKARMNGEGNVVAVDMESGQVAAVCRDLPVPYLTSRMISDRYDERIPGLFLGKGIERMKDISNAICFAGRMLVLRRKLADRLVELIALWSASR